VLFFASVLIFKVASNPLVLAMAFVISLVIRARLWCCRPASAAPRHRSLGLLSCALVDLLGPHHLHSSLWFSPSCIASDLLVPTRTHSSPSLSSPSAGLLVAVATALVELTARRRHWLLRNSSSWSRGINTPRHPTSPRLLH
jgi:hypothetical protein